MIHDCLGHVPPLMNQDYAELLTLIGKAAATTRRGDQVLALKRFSWFSIEFGLIEEHGETKVFGAGILSSTGEIPHSLLFDGRHPAAVRDRNRDQHRLRSVVHAEGLLHRARHYRSCVVSWKRSCDVSISPCCERNVSLGRTMTDIPLRKIDHVRFFVGNARQSAFFYRNAFGFDVVAYAGLETKVKHEAGYVLKQGEITFVLTSPLSRATSGEPAGSSRTAMA